MKTVITLQPAPLESVPSASGDGKVNPFAREKLRRRQFLTGFGALGTAAALGDALATYAPWLDYDDQARRTWDTPLQMGGTVSKQMRELVRYATLAPSGHNAQPWKFAVLENAIRIYPDYSRRLPIVDPQDRELWISLGCALENLEIAARSAGYETEITYPAPNADYIILHLQKGAMSNSGPLAAAIPHRRSTRSLYDGRAVPGADIRKMERISPVNGVAAQIITATDPKEKVGEYVRSGNRRQYSEQAFVDELVASLRFNKPEALRTLDGLYAHCSGGPTVPRWLGKRFVTTTSGDKQSATDVQNIRSSSGILAISAARDDKSHWINAGRLSERLTLTMTALNLKTAYVNQPVEVESLRSQLGAFLDMGEGKPQLLLRFGYADAMPRSLRRPVEQMLVETAMQK